MVDEDTYDGMSLAGRTPRARSRKSYYLQRALEQMHGPNGPSIRTPASLVTNTLANALLQFSADKQDRKDTEAETAANTQRNQFYAGLLGPQEAATGQASAAPPVAPQQPAAPPQPPSQAAAGPVSARQKVFARLLEKGGYSPAQASGIVGNLMQESGPDLNRDNPAEGSIGIANWRGPRADALRQFGGPNYRDLNTQADFLMSEMKGPEARTDAALRASQDPQGAAAAMLGFERPAGWTRGGRPEAVSGWNNRLANAQGMFAGFQAPPNPMTMPAGPGDGPDNTGQSTSAPGVPSPVAGAPPGAAPQGAPGGPQQRGIDPQQRAFVLQLMQNPDPRIRAQGEQMAMQLAAKAQAPIQWEHATDNGVSFAYNPQDPSQTRNIPVPQSAMSRPATPQEVQQQGYPQGTSGQMSPFNEFKAGYQPAQGFQGSGEQQSYIHGGPNDPASGQNRLTGLRDMRQEVKPILDSATLLRRNYSAVQAGFARHNGPGDIAMVNGLQKLIDEGIVKEGDVTMQLSAQGIQGGIAGALAYLNSSGKFDDRIRSQIMGAAQSLYGTINQTYRDRAMGYRGIVERTYGQGAFNDVIPPETVNALGWGEQPAQPQQRQQAAPAAAQRRAPGPSDIQALVRNPTALWKEFDAKFGPGAASHILNPAKYGGQ